MSKKLGTVKFTAELILEHSSTSNVDELGVYHNEMVLYKEGNAGYIVWNYTDSNDDEDETIIGLWFDGDIVIDYDGVFSIPREGIDLIRACGLEIEE